MQRFFDVVLSAAAIVLLLPILTICGIILKLTGEGEVFYLQPRVGKYGKHFNLYKFATMLKDSPNIGSGEITLKDDPRVLRFGKILRKSKINELPQLLNILKGDMSLVGPRPMVPKTFYNYGEAREVISSVRPGLTGIGSLIFRDEEALLAGQADPTSYYFSKIHPYKAQVEVWFVNNNTLILYFKIIVYTAIAVAFPRFNFQRYFPELPTFHP